MKKYIYLHDILFIPGFLYVLVIHIRICKNLCKYVAIIMTNKKKEIMNEPYNLLSN